MNENNYQTFPFYEINVSPGEDNFAAKIADISDVKTLNYNLQFYNYLVKNKLAEKGAVAADVILAKLNDSNADQICEALRLVYELHSEPRDFLLQLSRKLPSFDDKTVRLKILQVILERSDAASLEELRLGESYVDELLRDGELCSYAVTRTIPTYASLLGEEVVLSKVWEFRDLQLICALIRRYCTWNLFGRDEYWVLLQRHLGSEDSRSYKMSSYLLKFTLEHLRSLDKFSSESKIVEFEPSYKSEYFEVFDNYCTLLETSREKQLHLVQPSLGYLSCIGRLHYSWVALIYGILLRHPHNTISGLSSFMFLKSNSNVNDITPLFLAAINKDEYTNVTRQVYKALDCYVKKLSDQNYDKLLQQSLNIRWVPVAFWLFYTTTLVEERTVTNEVLLEIMKLAKRLPHKHVRHGIICFVFKRMLGSLAKLKTEMRDFLGVLLEFVMDDTYRTYVKKIIESPNLLVENAMEEISSWLVQEHPDVPKISLIVEIVNRKNVKTAWIQENIHKPFVSRKYKIAVLDQLTYCYCIKLSELQQYLAYRLGIAEEAFKICHCDKVPHALIKHCENVLLSSAPQFQHSFAFEILYYSSESQFRTIYTFWIHQILHKSKKIPSSLALNFINLLVKIPRQYLTKGEVSYEDVMSVYEVFFNTQPDEVVVKIFRNMDFIFGHVNEDFLRLCFSHLDNMKGKEFYEKSVCSFVRSIAISWDKVDVKLKKLISDELQRMSKNSELVLYYSVLYLNKVESDIFPVYKYVLYGDVLGKSESAEYEICKQIYLGLYFPSPCFRPAEIRKRALENILSDTSSKRIKIITDFLIREYRKYFKKRYFPDSTIHFQKLRIMQTLSFMTQYIDGELKEELKVLLVECFCEESHQPSVKQLMQYILVQLLREDDDCLDFITKIVDGSEKKPLSTLTGFIPIMYSLGLLKNNVEFSSSIVEHMIPWTMGAQFKLRLYSQYAIHKICEHNWTNRKFRLKYSSLQKATETVLSQVTVVDDVLVREMHLAELTSLEKPHNDRKKLIHFISVQIPEVNKVSPTEWEYYKIRSSWSKYMNDNFNKDYLNKDMDDISIEKVANVQKKILPWQDYMDEERCESSLIVITSLIDSAANVGGLMRTCEIFGNKKIVVKNGKLAEDRELQSLSMSSEKLVELVEVKVEEISQFVLNAKGKGFRIIGAEQAANSTSLSSYKFQEKTVLLLGNERSGIPPNFIPLLDDCVEIPQLGMVRSLNVHVAGAMFIWEYTKQHMLK